MTTFHARLSAKAPAAVDPTSGDAVEQTQLVFSGDPDADNSEWAAAQPSLSVSLLVRSEIADQYQTGNTYALTIEDVTPELLRDNTLGAVLADPNDDRASWPANESEGDGDTTDGVMAEAAAASGGEPVPFTEDGKLDTEQLAADSAPQPKASARTRKQ